MPTLLAISVLLLSACQQGQAPKMGSSASEWRVIESLGDARIEKSGSHVTRAIRAGDRLAGNSHIVTGKNAHLIMSRGDFQFAAGGDTSLVLPTSDQISPWSLKHGAVRIRLASAANAAKGVTTPHLIANGTTAVFDLVVDEQDTTITVTSGSVVLSAANGRHYATLVAGAAAQAGRKTGGRLEIQTAVGMPFQPSADLGTATAAVDAAAPKGAAKSRITAEKATISGHPASVPTKVVILPASRPRVAVPQPAEPEAVADDAMAEPDQPSFLPTRSIAPIKPDLDATASPGQPHQRFDRLTDGLLDDLPTLRAGARRGS